MLELNRENFTAEVLESRLPVLVDFWRPGCGACYKMEPILEEAAKEVEGKAHIMKLNVFECPELAQKYRVPATPTLIIFKNGEPIERAVGLRPKHIIIDKLKSFNF